MHYPALDDVSTGPKWTAREVPRASRGAISELHGLVAMILHKSVSPETGDCY